MLGWRLGISALLIPALIGLLAWDASLGRAAPVLFVICLLVGFRCAWELLTLLRREGAEAHFTPVATCILLLLLATWGPVWQQRLGLPAAFLPELAYVFGGCLLLLMVVHAIRFRQPGGHAKSLTAETFAVAYVGLLLSVTAQLRWLGPGDTSYVALGSVIAATKMGDVGAYTLGRLFGRRKMAPYLSPGKTWMGAFGAVLGGILGAVLWLPSSFAVLDLAWKTDWWYWTVAYGAGMGVAGLLGDLCESLIKRDVGVKDAAALLPGFGGLLDLMDSILFAGPVAVIIWRASFLSAM